MLREDRLEHRLLEPESLFSVNLLKPRRLQPQARSEDVPSSFLVGEDLAVPDQDGVLEGAGLGPADHQGTLLTRYLSLARGPGIILTPRSRCAVGSLPFSAALCNLASLFLVNEQDIRSNERVWCLFALPQLEP